MFARALRPDGTLVVTLDSGHVLFLGLFHGSKRFTFANLEQVAEN